MDETTEQSQMTNLLSAKADIEEKITSRVEVLKQIIADAKAELKQHPGHRERKPKSESSKPKRGRPAGAKNRPKPESEAPNA